MKYAGGATRKGVLILLNYRMFKGVFKCCLYLHSAAIDIARNPKPEHSYKNPSARIADTDSPFFPSTPAYRCRSALD